MYGKTQPRLSPPSTLNSALPHPRRTRFAVLCGALLLPATLASAAEQVKIEFPLARAAYQTNETIDLAVVRTSAAALPADELTLNLAALDGSRLSFSFSAHAAEMGKADAHVTEHLHLDGRLLRPGSYTLTVQAGGATAEATFDVLSHIRRSDFKIIQWGSRAEKHDLALTGEDSVGYNLIYAGGNFVADELIRGRADFMWCCTMSGAHQMDLRQECDWSDPLVLQGGEARVVARALRDRTVPNCLGVHFYDEPGLTWWKDPKTGVMSPFNIPSQDRSYQSAFGSAAPHYYDVKPGDADAVAKWNHLGRWKESFMEASWKYARFGVERVRPDFISATQSQYGWMAYSDGYYFNVARSLPIISGHGGYDDGPATYFYPSFFHEMGRARDLNKPIWYLPCWYGESSDDLRCQQYLSFMMNLQGMATPPDFTVHKPQSVPCTEGVVESNKLMARLGTIFTTMRVTRPPVAMLYSMSQNLGAQTQDMQDAKDLNKAAYEGGRHTRAKLLDTYLAGKMLHIGLFPLVEEDVLDGTLAANHKAIILSGVNHLEPNVVAALEAYATGGGAVLLSDDCQVQIKGGQKIGAIADSSVYEKLEQIWSKDQKESERLRRVEHYIEHIQPLAAALKSKFEALGIKPDLDADSQYITTSRQAAGDVEYLFAVNATPNPDNDKVKVKAATATLSIAADGRPIYDAIHAKLATEFKPADKKLSAAFSFGAGEMRVFARTNRPIGGVHAHTPTLFRDLTVADAPIRIELAASVLDDHDGVLNGSIPLQIKVIDPLGQTRYDLYRATDRGALRLDLPLAANDPAGQWKVTIRELLSNTEGATAFAYQPGTQCGALAGATQRAVSFGADRDNIFRLFRTHQDVTVVKGSGDYNNAAADRIATVLKPWGIDCKIVTAADANKARTITDEEAATWSGLGFGRVGAENRKNPAMVGFAIRGPAILLGTPEDNPLIKFAQDQNMLAYKPAAATFPGTGRGYLGWQRDAVGYSQESVTLIAYDEAGMAEAVGSLYEAVAGIDPLMKWKHPATAAVTPATKSTTAPEATVAWRTILPDRIESLRIDGAQLIAITAEGSTTKLDSAGKILSTDPGTATAPTAEAPKLPESLTKSALTDRIVKRIATTPTGLTAIAYWGGTIQIVDKENKTKSQQLLPTDIGDLLWSGDSLIVGLSDGTVTALKP